MKMKRVLAVMLVFAMVCAFAFTAHAATSGTVQTTEFGTFSYYINANGNGIGASTTITKPASYKMVRTYEEMRYNATGALYAWDEDYGYNITNAYTLLFSFTGKTMAGYATHEARGSGSIARYTSTILYP